VSSWYKNLTNQKICKVRIDLIKIGNDGSKTSIARQIALLLCYAMKKLREHIIFRVFWGMLALHILNIGIDAPDLFFQQKENLAFNDIESIVELVLEDYLDIDNAIAEHDDSDEGQQMKFEKKVDFYFEFSPLNVAPKLIPSSHKRELHRYAPFLTRQSLGEFFRPPERVVIS